MSDVGGPTVKPMNEFARRRVERWLGGDTAARPTLAELTGCGYLVVERAQMIAWKDRLAVLDTVAAQVADLEEQNRELWSIAAGLKRGPGDSGGFEHAARHQMAALAPEEVDAELDRAIARLRQPLQPSTDPPLPAVPSLNLLEAESQSPWDRFVAWWNRGRA